MLIISLLLSLPVGSLSSLHEYIVPFHSLFPHASTKKRRLPLRKSPYIKTHRVSRDTKTHGKSAVSATFRLHPPLEGRPWWGECLFWFVFSAPEKMNRLLLLTLRLNTSFFKLLLDKCQHLLLMLLSCCAPHLVELLRFFRL